MVSEFFNGNGTGIGRTMAEYYDTCSYGQVTVQPSQVKILGPIVIPCSGTLDLPFTYPPPSGNAFNNSNACDDFNPYKWQYYLDTVAAAQGVTATDFNHKIMLLPKGFANQRGAHAGGMGAGGMGAAGMEAAGMGAAGMGAAGMGAES